jgi:ATP-dependent exoDNAse (exonuclease V) beta subunit
VSPLDQDARDRARDDLDTSLLLEAGAGTGKTSLLVERVMSFVGRRGTPIERIVAITFSEKAAAEMRVRLRAALDDAVRGVGAWRVEARARFARAAEDLPLANVSTIHAFAGALLRERPVEAGVDPGFAQLDAIAASALFDEVWSRWEEAELLARAEPYRRALVVGVSRARVRQLARDLVNRRDLYRADAFDPREALDVGEEVAALRRSVETALALARRGCRAADDTLARGIAALARTLDAVAAAPAAERSLLLGAFECPNLSNRGRKENWEAGALDTAREAVRELAERTARAAALCGAHLTADLARWLGGFIDAYQTEKTRRGVLDFDDLLILARDLLRDRPDVRADLAARFDTFLVDEFQDTDPLQAEILILLASDAGAASGDAPAPAAGDPLVESAEIVPGRLFVVGDPKQSIYRFRRADIDVYAAVRARLSGGGPPLRITQNFRSVPGVATWVNATFAPLFAAPPGETPLVEFAPMVPERGPAGAAPAIVVLVPPDVGRSISAQEARALEAEAIAETIAADIASGAVRPRDVAILFRAMTDILPYEEALASHDVPFQVEGGREFFKRDEVQSLLACLTTVDDPEDPVALVAALRSPHFGISDDELAAFAADERAFRFLDDPGGDHPAIADSFATLRGLHARRHALPLHGVVESLLAETRILEFHALRGHGRRAVANLRKVAEKARAYEASGAPTLRAFVRWLESEALEGAESDSPVAEQHDDLVTLSTIHGAKGLEYGVVALANLHGAAAFRETFLVEGVARRLAFSLGDKESPWRTANFSDMRQREKERHREEEKRVLYVAATRARDRLILPAHAALLSEQRPQISTDLLGGLPPREAWRDGAVVDGMRIVVAPRRAGARPARAAGRLREAGAAAGAASADDTAAALAGEAEWARARAAVVARARAPLRIVTSRRLHAPAPTERWDDGDGSARAAGDARDAGRSAARGDGAIALGRLVHAVLEALPDLDPTRLDATLAAAAGAALCDATPVGTLAEARALASAILADATVARARRAPRLVREAPFSVRLGERLAEGTIDLLFEEEGEIVIVDYKTDRVAETTTLQEHAASRGHLDQAALYAQAVHAATARPIREAVLIYARASAGLSIPGTALLDRALPDPFAPSDDAD